MQVIRDVFGSSLAYVAAVAAGIVLSCFLALLGLQSDCRRREKLHEFKVFLRESAKALVDLEMQTLEDCVAYERERRRILFEGGRMRSEIGGQLVFQAELLFQGWQGFSEWKATALHNVFWAPQSSAPGSGRCLGDWIAVDSGREVRSALERTALADFDKKRWTMANSLADLARELDRS
jgi:hypothetical protein